MTPPRPQLAALPESSILQQWEALSTHDEEGSAYLAHRHIPIDGNRVRFADNRAPGKLGSLAGAGFRMAVPLRDTSGQIIALQLRRLDGGSDKIRSLGSTGAALFGDPSRLAQYDEVLIVEGLTDYLIADAQVGASFCVLGVPGAQAMGGLERLNLRDKVVYLAYDADEAGDAAAARVVEITARAHAKSVQRVRPKLGKDLCDTNAAGVGVAEVIEQAEPCAMPVSAATLTSAEPSASEPWPAPLPLPGGLLPVPTFDAALLPEALRPWIVDIAERVQCPIEYVAVGGIVALGSVIGRQCGIRPKRHDDWTVIPNLWGGAVGPPGVMKSPALDESLRPLKRLAVSARKQLDQALAEHEHKSAVAKAKREKLDKEIKKAVMDGKEPMDPEEHRRQRTECDIKAPTERRYVVNDTTVEKLGELLNENPNGLLLSRDELTGWLRQLDRDGHEGDRAFMLEAWAGNKGFTYDRIARGTVHIEAACVSILGGIQPGPLTDYLLAAIRGGAGDDGLVQRFQLLVYPDITREWRNVDRWPDTHAKNGAYAVFEHLDSVTPKGADTDADGLRYLRFDTDAQALFDGWRSELEQRLRNPDESPVITAHLSKYRKLMPALALIFHLADTAWAGDAGGPVSAAAAQLAVHWCVLLEAHARRIYQVVTERAQDAARTLAKRIEAGKLPDGFTAREVRRAGWSGLNDREDVERALELLEDLHWLRSRSVATGGRPTVEYAINPQVRKQP